MKRGRVCEHVGEGSTAISGSDSCDALLHTLVLCGIQETVAGEGPGSRWIFRVTSEAGWKRI